MAALLLRQYQQRIVASVGSSNAIIKMPTGSGKTIVAAALLNSQLDRGSERSLFLVPTHDLVDQQSLVLQKWCPELQIFRYSGGLADPPAWVSNVNSCLVSTPQAFIHLQKRKQTSSGWDKLDTIVFDEVHHMLKDHPYRSIALDLKHWQDSDTTPHRLQILGLSASLTYSVGQRGIEKELNRLCRELRIETMESPTLQELEAGGYVPQHGRNIELERVNETPKNILELDVRKPT